MSTATEATTEEHEAHEEHTEHLTPANYWRIALFLAIVTGVEVGIVYVPGFEGPILVISLIVLGIAKFLTVVVYFMHLKYEPFTMNFMFYFGLVGALALFIALLLAFEALFDRF